VSDKQKKLQELRKIILNICNPVCIEMENLNNNVGMKKASLNPNMSVISDSVIILEIVQGSGYCRVAKCIECNLRHNVFILVLQFLFRMLIGFEPTTLKQTRVIFFK